MSGVGGQPFDPWRVEAARSAPAVWPGRLLAVILASLPVAAELWPDGAAGRRGAAIVLLAVVVIEAIVGVGRLVSWRVLAASGVALAGLVAVAPGSGRAPLPIALLLLAAGHGALVRWPPFGPDSLIRNRPAALALIPLSAAGVIWFRYGAPAPTVLLIAVSLIGSEVDRRMPRVGDVLGGLLQRWTMRVVVVVSGLLVLLLALPIVYLPAAIGRLAGLRRGGAGGGWSVGPTMTERRRDAGELFLGPPRAVARRRHRNSLMTVMVVALVAVVLNRGVLELRRDWAAEQGAMVGPGMVDGTGVDTSPGDRFESVPWPERPAMAESSLAEALEQETSEVELIPDPGVGWVLGDRAGESVNIVDGRRVSSTGSCTECPRVHLVLAGGSLVFGIGQRDGSTVASALEALAAADGIELVVQNRGVPGWTIDQEARDLRAEEGSPRTEAEVIVFLDGYNDGVASLVDRATTSMVPTAPARLDWDRTDEVLTSNRSFDEAAATEVGRTAAERYASVARKIDADLREEGMFVIRFFQPDASASPIQRRALEASGVVPDGFYDRLRIDTALATMASTLEPMIIDLRGVFDGVADPLFLDTSHVNERGARLLAEAIYPMLREELRARAR